MKQNVSLSTSTRQLASTANLQVMVFRIKVNYGKTGFKQMLVQIPFG